VTVEVRSVAGADIAPYLDAVAALRIEVFRDWPYLYDGDRAYEERYLSHYAASPDSVFVLAFEGAEVIGASTGIPLAHDQESFQKPFLVRGMAPQDVFYFGESVLRASYRGQGLGHRFFDEREAWARRLGRFRITAFCAVEREADDPRRPAAHRGNEVFWAKRGYRAQDDMFCELEWRQIDRAAATTQRLRFWLRDLEPR
jgi:GNAT superfamily N-acetyltransferase